MGGVVEYNGHFSRIVGATIIIIPSLRFYTDYSEDTIYVEILQHAWNPSKRVSQGQPLPKNCTLCSSIVTPKPRVLKK